MGIRVEGRVIEIWGAGSSPLEPTYSEALIELPISGEDIREAVARAYNVSVGELPALEQSVCEAVISLLTEGKGEEKKEQPEKGCESCEFEEERRYQYPRLKLICKYPCKKFSHWQPKEKKECRQCAHYINDLECGIDDCIDSKMWKKKEEKKEVEPDWKWLKIKLYPVPDTPFKLDFNIVAGSQNKIIDIVKELWRRNK